MIDKVSLKISQQKKKKSNQIITAKSEASAYIMK